MHAILDLSASKWWRGHVPQKNHIGNKRSLSIPSQRVHVWGQASAALSVDLFESPPLPVRSQVARDMAISTITLRTIKRRWNNPTALLDRVRAFGGSLVNAC